MSWGRHVSINRFSTRLLRVKHALCNASPLNCGYLESMLQNISEVPQNIVENECNMKLEIRNLSFSLYVLVYAIVYHAMHLFFLASFCDIRRPAALGSSVAAVAVAPG